MNDRCFCGWKFGRGVEAPNQINIRCFNEQCEYSYQSAAARQQLLSAAKRKKNC